MIVRKLEKEDYHIYENFLLSFRESLFYFSTKYKDFLEELLEVESNYLILMNLGKIQAILPLMYKDGKFGRVVNTLPYYGSNGGILSTSDEATAFLLDYYYTFIKEVSASTYIENPLSEFKLDLECDILDKRIGHWTQLEFFEDYEENIMAVYHSKTRNLVRKGIKLGVEIEIDNSKMDFLYETHCANMADINGKSKDKRFFKLIDKHFTKGKDYNIYIAKYANNIIGAVLFFYYNDIVEYFTPTVVKEYRSYQSTSAIIYKAMVDASKNGFKWWNWGGTWLTQDGVYHFKKRFGAIDKEYRYFIKINNKDIYNASKEELLEEYDNFYLIPFDKLKG